MRWVALGTAESQPHQVCGLFEVFGLAFWDLFGRFANHGALPKGFAKRSFWSLSLHIFGECSARNVHFGAPQASAPSLGTSGGAEKPAKGSLGCAGLRWVATPPGLEFFGNFWGLPKRSRKALRRLCETLILELVFAHFWRMLRAKRSPKHQHHHFARAVVLKGLRSRQPVKLPLAGFSAPPLVPAGKLPFGGFPERSR